VSSAPALARNERRRRAAVRTSLPTREPTGAFTTSAGQWTGYAALRRRLVPGGDKAPLAVPTPRRATAAPSAPLRRRRRALECNFRTAASRGAAASQVLLSRVTHAPAPRAHHSGRGRPCNCSSNSAQQLAPRDLVTVGFFLLVVRPGYRAFPSLPFRPGSLHVRETQGHVNAHAIQASRRAEGASRCGSSPALRAITSNAAL